MTLLKHVATVRTSNVDKKSHEAELAVRLCNYTDVYYSDVLSADKGDYMQATASADQVRKFRLAVGDTILTKDSETADDIGVAAYIEGSAHDFVCGYHLAIIRPGSQIYPKFLYWALKSSPSRGQLTAAATGVTRFGLRTEALSSLSLVLPPLDDQRRIADFLDDQVGLLDHVIALRRTQADRLLDRFSRQLWDHFAPTLEDAKPLKTVARYREGPGIMAADFRDEGTPVIRLSGVKAETVTFDGCNYVDPAQAARQWAHLAVRAGELLISGSAGTRFPVVVPEDVEGAIPYTGLIRVWPRNDQISRDYLRYFLGSPRFSCQIDRIKTGVGMQHWGPTHLDQVSLPVPSRQDQDSVVSQLRSAEAAWRDLHALFARHTELLDERKRSAIAAAVSGEFDVTASRTAT